MTDSEQPAPAEAPSPLPLTVICDTCHAQGTAGEDPFAAYGDLIAFEPVPRPRKRFNGWTAQVQRAYIVALACTGSDRRACETVDRAQYGVTQLLKSRGSHGFREARDKALAMFELRGEQRIAANLGEVAAEEANWDQPPGKLRRGRRASIVPPPPPPQTQEELDEEADAWLDTIFRRYCNKLLAERVARLEGRIVAADFYLRQLTYIEVMFEVGAEGTGMSRLMEMRMVGQDMLQIAETPMSRLLDEARREFWISEGDPIRPEHPPRRYLVDHGAYSSEVEPGIQGGPKEEVDEQVRLQRERFAEEARRQIEWEAEARREYDWRSASDAGS